MNKLNYQFAEHDKEEKSLTVNKSRYVLTLFVKTLVNGLPSFPTNKANRHIATLQAIDTKMPAKTAAHQGKADSKVDIKGIAHQ